MTEPGQLELATLDDLWDEIKRRHSSALLVLENDSTPVPGKSVTQVLWSGSQCTILGMPRLALLRIEEKINGMGEEEGDE